MSLGQSLRVTEKDINEFIEYFRVELNKSIAVMVEWNNYILLNDCKISYKTKSIYELLYTSFLG